ncbi:S8 family peptidase [Haliangium sp.]|uniref:S8 family peptidase n=1 Tax=Haliangium sp. TaxID=2663208 RepID=UPI003D0B2E29
MLTRTHLRLFAAVILGGSLVAGCTAAEDDFAESVATNRAPLFQTANPVAGEYIVILKDDVSVAGQAATMNLATLVDDQAQIGHTYRHLLNGFSAKLSPQAVDALRDDPRVAYVEENGEVRVETVHNVGAAGLEGLDRVDQRTLPLDGNYDDHNNTGAGVNVYIVDTGINSSHNEFTGRIGSMTDFVGDGAGGEDCNGHGSHVASTSAGTQFGLAKDATLHAVRVLNCSGSGTFAGVVAGVDFVAGDCGNQPGPCVANMSLGGGFSQSLNDAVANAVAAGVPFAVAAGNESSDACTRSPASEPAAFTVAASQDNDSHASFSNFGSCVDIYAPGVGVLGADIGGANATQTISGTSMASPHVAGAIAQFLGTNPGASVAQVEQAMKDAATPGCVNGAPGGTANLIVFNDFSQSGAGQGCDGGGTCEPVGATCSTNSDCCSNKCRGRRGNRTCR